MAEEYVSKDQHRADLLELRSELKENIAGIRQEVVSGVGPTLAVLSKNVEHLTHRVDEGFSRVDKNFDRIDKSFDRIDRNIDRLQTTVQRQMWVLVGVVVLGFVSGVLKVVFFP